MKGDPADGAIAFDDGPAYERFMGRWSRAAGTVFLDWLAPPRDARWLEVGCGTGAFTELVVKKCAPVAVVATDPAVPQVEYSRRQPIAKEADFQVADAHALPFPDRSFDIIASALVLNFLSDSRRALSEMRRVGRSRGPVAGYVWDFASARAPNSCVALGLGHIGITAPPMPGTNLSTLESLTASFESVGFEDIGIRTFDVSVTVPHFDDFWHTQTPSFSPLTWIIEGLTHSDRMKLIDFVRAQSLLGPDGTVSCSARANAIRGRVP